MAGHHDHHEETPHDHDHEHEHEHGNEAATTVALAEHGHVHNEHGHEHEAGGHDHGSGVLGWIRGTFAHSHNVADQIDASLESNELGIWALKWSLVGLGITAFLQAIIVVLSGSVSLLADTIHNFGDATTSLPL